jgi:hypothetical protein
LIGDDLSWQSNFQLMALQNHPKIAFPLKAQIEDLSFSLISAPYLYKPVKVQDEKG